METFIAVCLGILVLELGVLIAAGVFTLLQIKKAAQAVEITAYKFDHRVEQTLSNGWVGTGIKVAMAAASSFMGRR